LHLFFAVLLLTLSNFLTRGASSAPDRWGAAMGLFMVAFVSYGATLVFFTALFPRLARNTPHARLLREQYSRGEISAEVYETEESMEKNRISNISTVRPPPPPRPTSHLLMHVSACFVFYFIFVAQAHSNIGYVATLLINLSVLLPLAGNPKVDNYTIVLHVPPPSPSFSPHLR
jgi:Vacuole effluxer Atg22 like